MLSCYNSGLLIMPVLGSPVGELWCLAALAAILAC